MSGGNLDRRAVAAKLVQTADAAPGGPLLVVCGLGSAVYDIGAAGDRPENFYLWGAMGGAAMIGLGLALAQPSRRVLVVTGDGEALMGLGALATVAAMAPANLSIVILDNGQFGETGHQRSHTSLGTDLSVVARGCGWRNVAVVDDMAGVEALAPRLQNEAMLAVIRISPAEVPRFLPPRDGAMLTLRLRQAIGVAPD